MKLFIDSTGLISLASLRNAVTEAYINDATVTFTVYESDRTTAVSGASDTMASTGSLGGYRGTFTATMSLNLTKDEYYWVKVVAVSGSSKKTVWKRWQAGLDVGDNC